MRTKAFPRDGTAKTSAMTCSYVSLFEQALTDKNRGIGIGSRIAVDVRTDASG